MDKIINEIVYYLKKNIDIHDEELLKFGINKTIETVLFYLFGLVASLILGDTIEYIAFLISFTLLRSQIGGYHLKNKAKCFFISFLILAIIPIISIKVNLNSIHYFICYTFAALAIVKFSPIDSEQKRLCANEKKYYKRKCIMLLFGYGITIRLTYLNMFYSISLAILFSIIMCLILLIIGIVKNKFYLLE